MWILTAGNRSFDKYRDFYAVLSARDVLIRAKPTWRQRPETFKSLSYTLATVLEIHEIENEKKKNLLNSVFKKLFPKKVLKNACPFILHIFSHDTRKPNNVE